MRALKVIFIHGVTATAANAVTMLYLWSWSVPLGVNGMSAKINGNVFVDPTGPNGRLTVYTRTGSVIREWYPDRVPWRSEVDNQGYVYICEGPSAQFWPTDVCKYTEEGTFLGTLAGAPATPGDVASDDGAYLYITSSYTVTKVTSAGSFVTSWGSKGSGPGQFNAAKCVTVGADGNVYVAETNNNHRVQVFTAGGSFIRMWGSYGIGPGLFQSPRDITMDRLGYIHVADNDGIELFTKEGSWVTLYGDETGSARHIDATPAGYVFVADYDPDGIDVYFVTDTAVAPASLGKVKALFR